MKRVIYLMILAAFLFVSVFPLNVSAAVSESAMIVNKPYMQKIVLEDLDLKPHSGLIKTELPTFDTGAFCSRQSYNYADKLSELERAIFDYFVEAEFGTMTYHLVFDSFLESISYDVFMSINFMDVLTALSLDCPELFFLSSAYTGCTSFYDANGNGEFDSGDRVGDIMCDISPYDQTRYPDIFELNTAMWNVVKQIDVSGCENRYELLKKIHNYIIGNTTYDPNYDNDELGNPRRFDAIGCLVDGLAVCQGYSEAFKIICDYFEIPCVCLIGMGLSGSSYLSHMWNAVLMDDGMWYLIDSTWDDQVTMIFYDYFLCGSQTVDTYFGGRRFDVSHVIQQQDLSPDIPFSTTAFKETRTNRYSRFSATYNSIEETDSKFLVRSAFDCDEPIYYNGLSLERPSYICNGAEFSAPTGANMENEVWQLCLIGDLDSDSYCTASDYSAAVNLALAFNENDPVTVQSRAADANGDGVPDVLDIVIIEKMIYGYEITL